MLDKIAPTEISMRAIRQQLQRNKNIRDQMIKTFDIKKKCNRHAIVTDADQDDQVVKEAKTQPEQQKSKNNLQVGDFTGEIVLNPPSSRRETTDDKEKVQNVNFERSLSPNLQDLLGQTWANTRPKSSNIYAKKRQTIFNCASGGTLNSNTTRPETAKQTAHQVSGSVIPAKTDFVALASGSKLVNSNQQSMSSFDMINLKSSASKPSLISPRNAISAKK